MIYDVMCDVKTKENKLMNFCELYEEKNNFLEKMESMIPKIHWKRSQKNKIAQRKEIKRKKAKDLNEKN